VREFVSALTMGKNVDWALVSGGLGIYVMYLLIYNRLSIRGVLL
jgi:hypothetical protein